MKKKMLWLLAFALSQLLLLGNTAVAQKHPKNIRQLEKQSQLADRSDDYDCALIYHMTPAERRKYFPFSKAAKVLLVSFKNNSYIEVENNDSVRKASHIPTQDDTVCYTKLKEVITLDTTQVNELSHVLFNNGRKGRPTTFSFAYCGDFENGMVFLDAEDKVIATVSLCFKDGLFKEEAAKAKDNSGFQMYTGELCTQRVAIIRKFFKSVGMKYVVEEEK